MDRRFVLAIVLMMVVLLVPPLFLKRPPRRPADRAAIDTNAARPQQNPTVGPAERPTKPPVATLPAAGTPAAEATEEDTVTVISQLYTYRFSTKGGRLIGVDLRQYKSMRKDERGQTAQVLPPNSQLLALG